ncbi:MAG TPA: alpha/beta hydrolase [Anaerolineales bacterium]|nr:alpha/beta hydrolase [Anaerolineales bacterium]
MNTKAQAVDKTEKVISKDGTSIAFEKSGQGPAIILVVGAFNDRATGAPLAQFLERHFTVFNYDRRGRGESSDTASYAVEREIEDLDALVAQADGPVRVFGYSSGAILALRAAAHGLDIAQLALYEPPPTGAKAGQLAPQLTELIAAGRRGDAVELFQTEAVGIPAAVVAQMRNVPFRPALEKIAHTLVYESLILRSLPTGLLASIRVPTLVIDGEESPEVMRRAAQSLAEALPDGRYRTLKGQDHDIVPAVLGPSLEEFFL